MGADAAGLETRVSAGQRYNCGSRRTRPNGAEHQLAGLITRRSQVQILPPLPRNGPFGGRSLFSGDSRGTGFAAEPFRGHDD